jgi:hypothetical protein
MPDMSQPAGARLLVAEQLMLLAFSAGDGRLHASARRYLPMGLAGAVLTELALRRGISLTPGRSPEKQQVAGTPTATGDPLLDGVGAQVLAEPSRTLAWWIRRLSKSGIQGPVSGRLMASGLVENTRGIVSRRLQLTQPAAHADVAARVRQALLAGPAMAAPAGPAGMPGPWSAHLWVTDPGSASLTSLAFACGVINGFNWLPREQRKVAKANLQAIRGTDPIGLAVAILVDRARRNQQASAAASATMNATIINSIGGV